MKEILRKVYEVMVPLTLRKKVHIAISNDANNVLRRNILTYYSNLTKQELNAEQTAIIEYLKSNTISEFPYRFQEKYDPKNVNVFLDEANGLRYVILNEKRLYFKRSLTEKQIKQKFNFLELEQDDESPHRYLSGNFSLEDGDVIADTGAAEGNFSLSIVEKAGKLYLFEADPEWIEALKATFLPWQNKVEIVNRYVSANNNQMNLTLDSFFENKQPPAFLKIDVEGAEMELLKGADKILSAKGPLKIAICTYHRQEDEKTFSDFLKSKGFDIAPSKGYMIFLLDKEMKAPYLRRGLIRATR